MKCMDYHIHMCLQPITIYVLRRLATWDKKYSAKCIFYGVLPYLTLLHSKWYNTIRQVVKGTTLTNILGYDVIV